MGRKFPRGVTSAPYEPYVFIIFEIAPSNVGDEIETDIVRGPAAILIPRRTTAIRARNMPALLQGRHVDPRPDAVLVENRLEELKAVV